MREPKMYPAPHAKLPVLARIRELQRRIYRRLCRGVINAPWLDNVQPPWHKA
jgi:hypothetical protein